MRAVNARILQHRRQLLGQWRERLTAFLNLPVFNDRDGMLGVEGLEELVRKSAQKALPEMKQAILDSVAKWRHGPLTNDMSLVLVELR